MIGIRNVYVLPGCAGLLALATMARADDAAGPSQLPTVVVESTAIPGVTIDIDKIPGNVQVLKAGDLDPGGVGEPDEGSRIPI